jgi:hypothetical protein
VNILGVVEGELRFMPALELPTCLGRESLLQPHVLFDYQGPCIRSAYAVYQGKFSQVRNHVEDAGYVIRRASLLIRE